MEVYNSSAASISYNDEHQCVLQTINNFLHTEELEKFQNALINFCKLRNPKRVIADATNLKVVKANDMNWLSDEVLPSLSDSGVKYFAIVMPDNPFGEMAVKLFVDASEDIVMKIFDDLPSAQQWIRLCA